MVIEGIFGALFLSFWVHLFSEIPVPDGRILRLLPRAAAQLADGFARLMTAIGIAITLRPVSYLYPDRRLADVVVALSAFLLAMLIWTGCETVAKWLVTRRISIVFVLLAAMLFVSPAMAQGDREPATALVNLNVRSCPRVDCAKLGMIRAGGKFFVDEVEHGWAGFSYWGNPGWVKADPAFVSMPGATGSTTEYRVASISLDPAIPEPGRAFRLVLSLEADQDTETSVGVLWANDAFAMAPVRLRAGAPVVVALENPGESATGPHQAVAMLDLDMREQPARDGKIVVDYFIDRAATRSSLTVRQFSNFDIDGGAADFSIAAGQIEALPGARIEASDTAWSAVHYDMIAPAGTAASIEKNVTLLAVTAEGHRAVLRIVSVDGPVYTVEFRVYAAP